MTYFNHQDFPNIWPHNETPQKLSPIQPGSRELTGTMCPVCRQRLWLLILQDGEYYDCENCLWTGGMEDV